MKIILFRGKEQNGGNWRYGSVLQYPNGDCYICSASAEAESSNSFRVFTHKIVEKSRRVAPVRKKHIGKTKMEGNKGYAEKLSEVRRKKQMHQNVVNHTMEWYLALRKVILTCAVTWMNIGDITLSAIKLNTA